VAVIAPKTTPWGRGLGRGLHPLPRIKIIILIITTYYLNYSTVGVRVSGSYSVENHRERGLRRERAPSPE